MFKPLSVLAAVLFVGAAAPAAETASARLQALFAASDEGDLKLSPIAALGRGDLRYADQFGDYITDEFLARSAAKLREDLRQLAEIPRSELPPRDRIAYDVFRYQAEFALRGFENGVAQINQRLPIDHLNGLHLSFADLSSGQGVAPYKTVVDYENGLKRFAGYVTFLQRAEAMMRLGLKSGHVQPRIVSETVVQQLVGMRKAGVDGSPYLRPVKNFPAEIGAEDRTRLEAAYRRAIGEQILPALAVLEKFMHDEYLPASRRNAPGLSGMKDGAKFYEYLIEQHTTLRLAPADIHAQGVAEVARIGREMDAIQKEVGFKGTRREFFDFQRKDARFKFKSADEYLEAYRAIGRRLEPEVQRLFARLPKAACEVRAVPDYLEKNAPGAYYMVGTPDGARPGVFYANTYDLPSRTSPRMETLYLHEAVPGHHFQGSLAQEDESLPALLRFGGNTAYVEGWALYTESLGPELGLYRDPYARFGALDMDMLRAMRLVVDTGLHAQNWSRQQAIDYMQQNSSLGMTDILREVDRYIANAGQALAYKIGQFAIRRLRAKAETKLGKAFEIRAFHDEVLNTGSLPLQVLEAKIDAWIEAQTQAQPTASGPGAKASK
ncbi:MAG: DUF885 domain-containing protein [Verrucomicrobia bacterium]|nr:DUF885 domain-containing protein [Verrucomicrobiota bacterium]